MADHLTPESVEVFAIRCALGNNGGVWLKTPGGEEHYTEEQKEHWRQFVRDLAEEIAQRAITEYLADTTGRNDD